MTRVWVTTAGTEAHVRDKAWLKTSRARGEARQGSWTSPTIDVVGPGPLPDVFHCGAMQIVSAKVIEIVRQHAPQGTVEALPVDLSVGGRLVTSFFVLNVLDVVDAIDRVRSELTLDDEMEDMIDEVSRLVIDENAASGHGIFWMRAWEGILCVSDELASAMVAASCTGVGFIAPAKWPLGEPE